MHHHVEVEVVEHRDLEVEEVVDPIDWRYRCCLHFGWNRSKGEECFGASGLGVYSTSCRCSLDLDLHLRLVGVGVLRIRLVVVVEVLGLGVPLGVLGCWVG